MGAPPSRPSGRRQDGDLEQEQVWRTERPDGMVMKR